jgi:hypothetical protein
MSLVVRGDITKLVILVHNAPLVHIAQVTKRLPSLAPQELPLLQGKRLVQTAWQELLHQGVWDFVLAAPQDLTLAKQELLAVLPAPQGPTVPRKGLLHL